MRWIVYGMAIGTLHAASSPVSDLAAALAREDLTAVTAAVQTARQALGDRAGIPEVEDQHLAVPRDARRLTLAEAQRGFVPYFRKLESLCWWHIGDDPEQMRQPLRAPASVLAGQTAVCRAKLEGAAKSLEMAHEAAEFLMWAQERAGSGGFPFPAARGVLNNRAMAMADDFMRRAEAAGKQSEVIRHGWIIDDLNTGGLQFDNGECGVALFEYYTLTKDARALAAARRSADWAAQRPLVPNWNYNSFSVWLLAKAHAVTGEKRYLEAAVRKARIGVIPGQLTDGPQAGRWLDPHNARPEYHYLMLRALAQLAAVMPADHPDRRAVMAALGAGLRNRNTEIVTRGVMNRDKALQTLILVNRAFSGTPDFLRETRSVEALEVLGRLISFEIQQGRYPLAPGEWGLFLESWKTNS
jgi:hypothetical protein